MALPYPISAPQTAAKAPVDQALMDSIRNDLDYLDTAASSAQGLLEFKINGNLSKLSSLLPYRRIDGAFISNSLTLSNHKLYLEVPGTSGVLECDVRKYKALSIPITGIDYKYQDNVNSITLAGSAGSTQSITKATPQVNTQSVALWKTAINISSIIYIGNNLWRYNLASAVDADWAPGDTVRFASCTSGGNNGDFPIVRLGDDGGNNIIIFNTAGVAQTSTAGNVNLLAWAYTLTNPASSSFVAGEKALFASHTSGGNNGSLPIYKTNQGGNNLIVKNPAGVAQAGVAGTIDSFRWVYTLAATVSSDLVVSESGNFSGHTSSVNDGTLPIVAISGSTLTVYNESGALQGGVAGSVNSYRWIYALASNPSGSFNVAEISVFAGCTSVFNNGSFPVKQVNRSGTNNVVVYNPSGVTQAGAAGTATHSHRIVKFASDQSSIFATNSRVGIRNCPDANYNSSEFDVKEVNRGGGSNYNIVIDQYLGASQASVAGRVAFESRSIFSNRPSISTIGDLQVASNGVLDNTEKVVAAGSILAIEILQIPSGSPQNATLHVS